MFKEKMISFNDVDYIHVEKDGHNFLFSLKNDDGDYKRNTIEFDNKLKKLSNGLGLKSIGYSDQTHSTIINIYDGTVKEGDSTVTDKEDIGICAYTADCVPILIKHKILPLKAAIHSGWKGTYDIILLKTIRFLKEKYKINSKDLLCCVGPHIKACCYEVSEDMIEDFNHHELYSGKNVTDGRFLNLTKCIELQLDAGSILKDNRYFNNQCTKCSSEYEFHSYRLDKDCGRIISLVY